MGVNKVVLNTTNGEETIVDLTNDTVSPQTLAEGATAHDASGEVITGQMPVSAVLYTPQILADEQKIQARNNIGAAPASHADQHIYSDTLTWDGDETGRTVAVIGSTSNTEGKVVLLSEKVLTSADLVNGYIFNGHEYPLDDAEINSDGAMMLPSRTNIFVIPADNYVYKEFYDGFTFPKAGVYFYYEVIDGEVNRRAKSLTIPGYNFADSTDPIAPEMISAAPGYHASESREYGVGTANKYGHLKIADLGNVFTGGEENLLDIATEFPMVDPTTDLEPYAFGAFAGYTVSNILWAHVNENTEIIDALGTQINTLQNQTLKQTDRQNIINDALNALAGADPNNATAAVVENLSGRTGTLETKFKNMNEDIADLEYYHDNLEYAFVLLHNPKPTPEDPEKTSFVYTSGLNGFDINKWYDDITLMSPTGDVYAGRKIDNIGDEYTRKKLATEEYVQNAMILTAPNGNRFRLTVDNNGNLGTVAVN